jgi:hypothetical protein
MIMAGLRFKLDDSPVLPDKLLQDPTVPDKLVGASASYSGQQTLGGIGFTFGVETRAGVEVFNAPSDKDDDGVAGARKEDVFTTPPLVLNSEQAWLKFRTETGAKVSASAKVVGGGVSFVPKIDSNFSVTFTDFHAHNRQENLREAVLADLTRLRFAGNVDDIFELNPQEALSYQARGELSASVTLSWSDIFTTNLSALSALLKGGEVLAFQVGGSVTFNVGLVDDFRVVFLRDGANRNRVAVRKTDVKKAGVAASLGLSVGWANPNAIKKVLTGYIRAVAGAELDALEAAVNKASLGDLPDLERKLLVRLFERLGVKDDEQPWNRIRQWWDDWKAEVTGRIKAVAEAKVALGFKYEYLRTEVNETLLEVELSDAKLREFHNDLMLCDTVGLLDWAAQPENADALKTYLRQKTVTRERAWGFTLGLLPWIKIGGLDKDKLTFVERKDEKLNRKQVAYRGVRQYEDKGKEWASDFKADMPGFSAGAEPTACEFEYGFHFRFQYNEKSLSEGELARYFDHAVIWRALSVGQLDQVKASVGDQFGERAVVSVELKFGDDVLRRLLPRAAAATDTDGARALARAMPYWEDHEARRSPRFREACYTGLWLGYFADHDAPSVSSFAKMAADFIRKLNDIPGHLSLAAAEGLPVNPPLFNTFAGQIYHNGLDSDSDYSMIYDQWRSFQGGLKQLNAAIAPDACKPHREIEKVYKNLARFWGQSLYIRAAGVFLTDLAAEHNLLSRVERTMTVTLTGGEQKAVIFSSSLGKA